MRPTQDALSAFLFLWFDVCVFLLHPCLSLRHIGILPALVVAWVRAPIISPTGALGVGKVGKESSRGGIKFSEEVRTISPRVCVWIWSLGT